LSERIRTLGFVGGCLAAQQGLGYSRHFHRILVRRCREELDLRVRMRLRYYHRFSECLAIVRNLLERHTPDALVLSIRPQPFLALAKLLVKHVDPRRRVATALHPALLRRGLDAWDPRLDRRDDRERRGERARGWRAPGGTTANLLAGRIVGLDSWAMAYVLEEIARVRGCCDGHGTPLIVLGMPASPETRAGDRLCRLLHHRARAVCGRADVTYLDCSSTVDDGGSYLFSADGVHLNEHGHRLVADRLFAELAGRWGHPFGMLPAGWVVRADRAP
jgi:hypothetical protein